MKHVLQIIKACKENEVSELEFSDFVLRFSAHTNKETPLAPTANKPEEIPEANQERIKEELLAQELLDAEKEDTALMILRDPLGMENRIAKGELVDAAAEN